jgi:hypothetical protein
MNLLDLRAALVAAARLKTSLATSLFRIFVLSLIASLWLLPAFGQGQFGQITGLVTDSTGGAVPGSNVEAINEATGVVRSTTTNGQGNYTITSLIPGEYKTVVSKPGFKSASRIGIELDVSDVVRIDVTLEVGQVNEQVSVTGTGPLLQTEAASVGAVVAQSGVVDLPLNAEITCS